MSEMNEEIKISLLPEFKEACWPAMMIWERINHAYTSDSPPWHWGYQKGNYGFLYWVFTSQTESYTVAWDSLRSYWKVKTPFGPSLFLIGPPFIGKSGSESQAAPQFSVSISETDVLMPASPLKVNERMLKIARFVLKEGYSNIMI
ncbi:hypothetical protein GDO78_018150 [Eleutherodactylus coqui]|uniref:Uncharacterized protein n=1 Tax=Eleutherodactylus coqui TaxID=57060 RepID=A0A8J6E7W1_ELECQ|nr:hypothetical protein GDO78_018150 [Eleutherodactylus coqui]